VRVIVRRAAAAAATVDPQALTNPAVVVTLALPATKAAMSAREAPFQICASLVTHTTAQHAFQYVVVLKTSLLLPSNLTHLGRGRILSFSLNSSRRQGHDDNQ